MVTFLRTASTKVLVAASIGVSGLMIGGAMVATGAASNDAKPAPKPLAQALVDSRSNAAFEGVTARVTFSNRLIDSAVLPAGSDPLLGGGSGRLWADANGRVRIELQSDGGGGDVQIVADGKQVWVSHGPSSSVYRAVMPADTKRPVDSAKKDKTPPTVASIEKALTAVAGDVKISDPVPGNVGGRPAYTVTLEPTDTSGLLGGARISWDATNGAPLALAILAKGQADPVMDLRATDVNFGPIDSSVFAIQPPSDAKMTDIPVGDLLAKGKAAAAKAKASGVKRTKPVTGLKAVQAKVPFTIVAPATLAGRNRSQVVLVRMGKDRAALITYGTNMGSIVVIESATKTAKAAKGKGSGFELPTKKVAGLDITELGSALGSLATFSRDGITFAVAGSVTADTLESAISGL